MLNSLIDLALSQHLPRLSFLCSVLGIYFFLHPTEKITKPLDLVKVEDN